MLAAFPDCGTENPLLAHPGIELAEHEARLALIGTLQALIEAIFGRTVLLFGRGVGANEQDVQTDTLI